MDVIHYHHVGNEIWRLAPLMCGPHGTATVRSSQVARNAAVCRIWRRLWTKRGARL